MRYSIPKSVKLWGRGQLTIPKEVRDSLRLDEESQLNVFTVGRCLILTPKKLLRAPLAREAEKSAKARGLGLEDLLESLKNERRRYNRETYGS